MFEITRLYTVDTSEVGAEMEIVDPVTGKGTGAFLHLAGVDSHTYRKAQSKAANKRLQRRGKVTVDDLDQEAQQVLCACTLGWRGLQFEGEEWPCTPENIRTLFAASPEVRQQAEAFINDRTNFIQD